MFYITTQIKTQFIKDHIFTGSVSPLARFLSIIPVRIREYRIAKIGFEKVQKRSISLKWVNFHSLNFCIISGVRISHFQNVNYICENCF